MNLVWKKNEETGSFEARTSGKLMSVSTQVQKLKNANETEYRIATVKLENGVTATSLMYEKSYNHGVEVGNTYSVKLVNNPGTKEVLVVTSHLAAGQRITMDDLGIELPKEEIASVVSEFEKTNKAF